MVTIVRLLVASSYAAIAMLAFRLHYEPRWEKFLVTVIVANASFWFGALAFTPATVFEQGIPWPAISILLSNVATFWLAVRYLGQWTQ